MLDEWLQRYLAFYVSLINTCKKYTPHPLLKISWKLGGVKKNYSYPPNILEGNGVVFGNLTFNKFHGNLGGQKELFIPPPNILEGNGVVFGSLTFN